MWKPFVKCLSPPLLPSKMHCQIFACANIVENIKECNMISRRTRHLKVDSKAPKKSHDDNNTVNTQKKSILLFHSWLFITSQKQLYTLIIISENGIKCQKNINLVLVGIYIIFNNTAKTRIFFWMNLISRKTEHKTLNARKMNTNFKNQITWI